MTRYGDQEVSQFRGAEMIAEKWDISREDMEAFAIESHQRALRAIDEGRFEREIVPFERVVTRRGPARARLGEDGVAAHAASRAAGSPPRCRARSPTPPPRCWSRPRTAVRTHGLTPRARIHHLSCRGADPIYMLTAPIPATAYALGRTGMSLDDIDLVEINEAFASVVLAWQKETGADLDTGQRQRRRHRPRPPARRHRHPPDDHAALRARAHRRPLRPPDHVRGRRPGQRHHHRTPR